VFSPQDSEEEQSVEVVATKWLNEDKSKCFWPSMKKTEQNKAKRLAMSLSDVKPGWPEFDVKFEKSYSESYSITLHDWFFSLFNPSSKYS